MLKTKPAMKIKIILLLLAIFTICSGGTAQITVGIAASPGTTVCDTAEVTFTMSFTSGSCTVAYNVNWIVNGIIWHSCNSCNTWTTTLFTSDTIVWCDVNCSPMGSDLSNALNMTVTPCAGIEEYTNGTLLTLYPNPSTGSITIDTEKLKMFPASLIVFDTKGRRIDADYEIKNRSAVLNAKQFPDGIYYYRIADKNGDKTATGRFVISQ